MSISSIHWNTLAPYGSDKRRSFEELCYQLTRLEVAGRGLLTRIEGSGGDGGVEFYLTLPSGDVWGWQAKFFYPDLRISDGRKTQIKRSLQAACRSHLRLVRWTLVTPGNLTDTEMQWFRDTLATSINDGEPVVPAGRTIDLVSTGESELLAALGLPSASGLRSYFFGDLELSLQWFEARHVPTLAMVKRKFIPTLHAATEIDTQIEHILAEDRLTQRVTELVRDFRDASATFYETSRRLAAASNSSLRARYIAATTAATTLASALKSIDTDLAVAVEGPLGVRHWRVARDAPIPDLTTTVEALNTSLRELDSANEERRSAKPEDEPSVEQSYENLRDLLWRIRAAADTCRRVVDELRTLIEGMRTSEVHLLGSAGEGKTHIAAHLITRRLAGGLPGILLLGQRFTSGDPIDLQIRRQLDIEHVSWNDFLGALATCAEVHGCRIPLVIDGLNEAVSGGILSPIWRNHLAAFSASIAQRTDSVVVITTCRPSYRDAIWESDPPGLLFLEAGTNYDVREAVEKYFQHYKIVADPTAAVLSQFEHPIYLRLFCETLNPTRSQECEVVLGDETLYGIFGRFLEDCNTRVRTRLGRARGANLVPLAVRGLGREIWNASARTLTVRRAVEVVDGRPPEEVSASQSVLSALEQEDVVITRDWGQNGEVVSFAFDLMAGYCIAEYLLETPGALSENGVETQLFASEWNRRHPLAEDTVRALAALAPGRTGKRLADYFDCGGARQASVAALFEMDPKHVRPEDCDIVANGFRRPANREFLFNLAEGVIGYPAHPLNARFWSELLRSLTMPDRDVTWTDHIRMNRDSYSRRVASLEASCRARALGLPTLASEDRTALLAEHVAWMLTSTIRPLRDEATRALYWFGRAYPLRLLALVERHLPTNDPYVLERLLASLYGVVMARSWETFAGGFVPTALPTIVTAIFEALFAESAPFATSHILARDYASNLIARGLGAFPGLLTEAQKSLALPPFAGTAAVEWPTSDDRNEKQYREGNSPLGMDFANYTLGTLVPDRQNYDFQHPEYVKVRGQIQWRMYQLGYSLEIFGDLDQRIARRQSGSRAVEPGKTDRYGKKYAWIAFFELAGTRASLGLLPKPRWPEPRLSDVDIDPSFPDSTRGETPPFIPTLILPPAMDPMDALSWFKGGGVPDLSDMIIRKDIGESQEEWLLLEGSLHWGEQNSARHVDVWFRSFVVDPKDATTLAEATNGGALPEGFFDTPSDYYLFAGEVPWSEHYLPNDSDEIRIIRGSRTVTRERTKRRLTRGGQPLPDSEARKIIDVLATYLHAQEGEAGGAGDDYQPETDESDQSVDDVPDPTPVNLDGVSIETIADTIEEQVIDSEDLPAVPTCRHYGWESYHTTTTQGRVFTTLDKPVAMAAQLHARPDCWELFDATGARATHNMAFGDYSANHGHLFYVRADAVRQYLSLKGKALLVFGRGQRIISGSHVDALGAAYSASGGRGTFDKAWTFGPDTAG